MAHTMVDKTQFGELSVWSNGKSVIMSGKMHKNRGQLFIQLYKGWFIKMFLTGNYFNFREAKLYLYLLGVLDAQEKFMN